MHNLHTFERRLICIYTLRQHAREKTKKYGANAPQLRPIFRILKNMVQMRHSCALSGRKQPQALIRQHLCPLSIKDGEGARG
jgi:hypothetical protein